MRTTNTIQEYAQKYAPKRYSKIQNPETYFHNLLNQLHETQQDILQDMGPEPETNDPLKVIGQHRARVAQARELAWERIVTESFPAEVDETGTPLEV